MKVAHHGSKTSTTKNFLAFVQPEIAAISVAKRNKFGHPSTKVLERLSGYGSKILRTDRQKAIWLRLKKGQWKRVTWE
jgi:competence protein ComEC